MPNARRSSPTTSSRDGRSRWSTVPPSWDHEPWARARLAPADDPKLAARLNGQVKHRYPFQPFAGAFLEGEVSGRVDEHMSYAVRPDRARGGIAGILHRDGSCRAQVVPCAEDSMLRDLLLELRRAGPQGSC